VVVCGHYDTEYNSPGAIDNASGVAGVLEMAERLADANPRRAIRYIAFGAEEPMMIGSSWHVRRLKDRDELRACVANVCLDMIACNEPTWIWATDGELRIKNRAERAANAIGIPEKYRPIEWVVPPWGTSDHYPFQLEGVGVLCCTWHGDTWPHTHLPSDTVEHFDADVYQDTLDLCEPVIRDLARDLR
jgi:Zn-dependent M28 family amino/carboxypeptidase